jgi:hypothetical protein
MAGVPEGEPHVGQGRVGELWTRGDERRGQQLKSLGRQRGKQASPIGEVLRGRGM